MNTIAREGWWQRHWKWALPVGCLTMLLLFVGALMLLLAFVFGLIKQSEVFTGAMQRARDHDAVLAALGRPLAEGLFVSGQIHTTGPSGDADLAIPLSGPIGRGTLYVVAQKVAGEWEYRRLELEVDGDGRRIDLLAGSGTRR